MKLIVPFLAALPMLWSCSTLTSNQAPKEYAPENLSESRTGMVVYNPVGLQDLVDARRNDAYKKIVEFCGSRKYKISKEETVTASPTEFGSLATLGANSLKQIHFVCE